MADESTTPDLVELLRGTIDPVTIGDLDAALRSYSPDCVFDMSSGGMGTLEGKAAIRAFVQDWFSSTRRMKWARLGS